MLHVNKLFVSVQKKQIIKNCSLSIKPGTVNVIMGPNGSGKSTLARTLLGDPNCVVESGTIFFDDKNITDTRPDERARAGLFLVFQYPCAIPGLTVFSFLKESYNALHAIIIDVDQFRTLLYKAMDKLGMDHSFAFRNVNEGFSGGEKKRLEVLQLLLFKPKLVILDELDSGLDVDTFKTIMNALVDLKKENKTMSYLIITHYQKMLQHLKPDVVHLFNDGTIIQSGDYKLAKKIDQDGFAKQ